MQAKVVDLRYRMRKVLRALEARETVAVYARGKLKGIIVPPTRKDRMKAHDHPSFGILKGGKQPMEKVMDELRGDRNRAIRH